MIIYTNGDCEFDVEELPLDRWIEIQKATGRQWHECLTKSLLADVAVAKAVLDACAAHTGTTLPPLTVKSMLGLFRFEAAENTPTGYREGTPDPKAKGSEPATT